jgi:hypothetical protein
MVNNGLPRARLHEAAVPAVRRIRLGGPAIPQQRARRDAMQLSRQFSAIFLQSFDAFESKAHQMPAERRTQGSAPRASSGVRQIHVPRGKGTGAMKFLLRAAFWLTVVALLLPAHSRGTGPAPQLRAGEAVSAASAAVSDMRQFCARQPDACVVGSQALAGFGEKAKAGVAKLYDLLVEHFGGQPAKPGQAAGRPGQNTLSPADLTAPWRGSPPRKEAEAKRPA